MPLLTILTATYNRALLLQRVYKSLIAQTSQNFEWLVIDDGSIDNTDTLVQSWVKEGKISIRYLKKENGGKHTAINLGVQSIGAPLTLLLDSDDWIVADAVEQILFYHRKYNGYSSPLCCFTFHQQTGGKINGGPFPKEEQVEHYPEFQVNKWHGDTVQVFYTDVLREFPFPEFPGKLKMVSEDIVWIPMGLKYATVFVRKIITISEYQAEGLTRNLRLHQNYLSQYQRGCLYMHPRISIKYRLRGALMVNVYARFCYLKVKKNTLTLSTYFLGYLVYRWWKLKYKMEEETANHADFAP